MASPERLDSALFERRDLLITCRNSQGAEIRSTPVRVTRHLAVLEVYNPDSLIQVSEVLSEFKITVGDQCKYSGTATVAKLINADILLLVEVSLDAAYWLDRDLFSPIAQPDRLREEFETFVGQWRQMQAITPDFKVAVADFQLLLAEIRRWLDQVELGVQTEPEGRRSELSRKVLRELEGKILPEIDEWAGRFDAAAEAVEESLRPACRVYARHQIHPLVLCSPFVLRTFTKPLGYAGDYEMVNMILGDPMAGSTLFARMVNVVFLRNPPAEAHRNRIQYLHQRLIAEAGRLAAQHRRLRVLNLGCGPAREVQLFLAGQDLSNTVDFTLLDFNQETLDFVKRILGDLRQQHQRTTGLAFERKSVDTLLREARRPQAPAPAGQFDFIYCAGLFDYISDRVCRRLTELFYAWLAPGGSLLVSNVDAARPFRHSMAYILDWHLLCRNREQMKSLLPQRVAAGDWQIHAEATGVNIFLEIRRPEPA